MCNDVGGCRIELWDELGQVNSYMKLLAKECPVGAFATRTSPGGDSTLELVICLRRRRVAIAQ